MRAIRAVADVKSMAHITGGGLLDNIPRTLPANAAAVFEPARWDVPPIMAELVRRGNLGQDERYRTLNMGVGYTLIVPVTDVDRALAAAPGARVVGFVQPRRDDEPQVIVRAARRVVAVNLLAALDDERYGAAAFGARARRGARGPAWRCAGSTGPTSGSRPGSTRSSRRRGGRPKRRRQRLDRRARRRDRRLRRVRRARLAFPWLRAYRERPEVGMFGPYGVATAERGRGLGEPLLDAALCGLRASGYAAR